MGKSISYYARDFLAIKSELIEYLRRNYPDTVSNFDDASVGTALIEMVAAVGDMLSFNLDRVANEIYLDNMQQRSQLFDMASNYGVKIPPRSPAVTICEFAVDLPVRGDTFDLEYAPFMLRGTQVTGNGQTFETLNPVDFSSPFSASGTSNRTIEPLLDSSGTIRSYRIKKSEVLVAGRTKYFSTVLQRNNVKPFMEITLPDEDVLSIEKAVLLDGTNYNRNPTLQEELDDKKLWYVVDSLAESEIFIPFSNVSTDNTAVIKGQWKRVQRKFSYSFDINGRATLQFGNGTDVTFENTAYTSNYSNLLDKLNGRLISNTLGLIPKSNSTFFVKYRVGGGQASNVAANTLTSINNSSNLIIVGNNPTIQQQVRSSLTANNPIPALGGRNELSNREIKYLVKNNFSAQNRAVTIPDYYTKVLQMDSKFGKPSEFSVYMENGNVIISILNKNNDGSLSNESTNTLKQNIYTYLTKYKSPNDFVIVEDGRIINIGFEIDILAVDLSISNQISSQIINKTYNYINDNAAMGQPLYLSKLTELLNSIFGVRNIIAIRVFNKTVENGDYSTSNISQSVDENGQVDVAATMSLNANFNEMFEIKYKNKDIKVRLTQ